jgi:Holliday junction resolvasome RuvABC endonuclease subunit
LVDYRKHIEKLIIDNDIEEVAFEDIQMQGQVNNVQTFKVLAEIFGVTQEFLVENGHSYHIVSSNTWKSKLQIKGRTRVEQKRNAQIYVLENFDKKVSQDESDAICIGASIVLNNKKNKADFNWS